MTAEVGADCRVSIVLASEWLGLPPLSVRLECCALVASHGQFGSLRVERLVELVAFEKESRDVALPELPFPPLIEFCLLPPTDSALPADSELAELVDQGRAQITESWELMLWIHPYFERPTPADGETLDEGAHLLTRALAVLDKVRCSRL